MKTKIFFILITITFKLSAQFAGPVGSANTTAMHADSNAFVAWGAKCKVVRGYQDISNTSLGYASLGDSSMVPGKADGSSVVSLGDAGEAIVTFSFPINNGAGYDFAVFENGFNNTFLELAFVEVSCDGINFFRFPATSNSQTSTQFTNGAVMDATKIDNLAGKYRAMYGTPFDLQELVGASSLLNVNSITHVKIIDVVGSLNVLYARFDKNNNPINDPWPTPFASSGFDLDAVGVIHQAVGIKETNAGVIFKIFPNPVSSKFEVQSLKFSGNETVLIIKNCLGEELRRVKITNEILEVEVTDLASGIYFVSIVLEDRIYIQKLIKE